MNNLNKVKKWISANDVERIVSWMYTVTDNITWELIPIATKNSKYKLKLSIKKIFMKKWLDNKLNIQINKELRPIDLWFIYIIINYIDDDNIINFHKLKSDYWYNDSQLSKAKKPLLEKEFIKKTDKWLIYLNPLIWIKWDEIGQELIYLFKESFEKYWVEINYN